MRKAWLAAEIVCLFTAGWLRAGSIASPPAACPAGEGPLASYLALSATACTAGAFTNGDFQFAVQPGSTGTPVDASALAEKSAASLTILGIRFPEDFSASGGQQAGNWLTYSNDPPPPIIGGFGEELFPIQPLASPPPIIRDGQEIPEPAGWLLGGCGLLILLLRRRRAS